MLTANDKQLIIRLIKKYSGHVSTDSMIAFVADTGDSLLVCKELINSNNQNDQQTIGWLDEQCFKHQVDVHGFLFEIEQIVSIFQPGQGASSSHYYDTLGLDEDANVEEVKRAYRKLSRRYHPDTSASDTAENRDMFLKINKAYHALLEDSPGSPSIGTSAVTGGQWRNSKKNTISRAQKKKNLLWFSVLALVLIVVSLVVASNYRKRLMLAGLQSSRAAFIPPKSEVVVEKQEPKEVVEIVPPPPPETGLIESSEEKIVEKVPPPPSIKEAVVTPEETVLEQIEVIAKIETADVEETVQSEEMEVHSVNLVSVVTVEPIKQKPLKKVKKIPVQQAKPVVIAAPVPSPPKKIQVTTQQKINRFLASYTKSYEEKDLLGFSRFYDTKATENGKPLAEMLTTYSDLFGKSDSIGLTITVLKWNTTQGDIHLDGRFGIDIRYKDSTQVSGKGRIFFLLSEVNGQLEIQELTYQFDTE
jgi:hypothetical protein